MKSVLVLVNNDIVHAIGWAMKEFDGRINTKYLNKLQELKFALDREQECCTIILDAIVQRESTLDTAKMIKAEYPGVKMLLVVDSDFDKGQLVQIIQSKMVDSVLVRPFTAVKVSENITNLCGFKKIEKKWYEHNRI